LSSNLIQVRNMSENEIAVQDERGDWRIDKSFHPFFYVYNENFNISKLDRKTLLLIKSIGYANKKVLWHTHAEKSLNLRKINTISPGVVPQIANFFVKTGARVFQADLPYLFNYLFANKFYLYKNVSKMRTVIFDVETYKKRISKGRIERFENVPFLICAEFGDFDLQKFKFESKGVKVYNFSDPSENVKRFFNDVRKNKIVLNAGHNVTYDWKVLVDYGNAQGVKCPQMVQNRVFQKAFHDVVWIVPKFMTTFDTMLGVGVSMPRPVSYKLKPLVSALKLRGEHDRVYLDTSKIFDLWNKSSIERERVVQYCLDDVNDTRLLFDYISAPCFIPAMEAGISVENFLFSGVKAIWESLMARQCIEENILVPQYDTTALDREREFANPFLFDERELGKVKGGLISEIDRKFKSKVLKNVFNVDITSAFPTITLQYNISPETVIKCHKKEAETVLKFEEAEIPVKRIDFKRGVMVSVLERINDIVIDLKRKKKVDPSLVRIYKGFKAIRDSHYAVPGIRQGRSRFKNRYCMGLVHHYCREILSSIISELETRGYEKIFVDTDGVLVHSIEEQEDPLESIRETVEEVSELIDQEFNKNIEIDIDSYESLFMLNPKSYVYREFGQDQIVHFKGILNARTIPNVVQDCLSVYFNRLFDNRIDVKRGIKDSVFKEMREMIYDSENVRDFALMLFLKDVKQYKNKTLIELSKKFGSGSHQVCVIKTAKKTPKPYENFASIFEIGPENIDRNWYWYYLTSYLIEDICNLPVYQKTLLF